jgi:FKBP-type peptidyl-prolyl cis-trans isomerase FklB
MDKASYALGLGIGHQLKGMGGDKLNIDDFASAIKDVIGGKELKMSMKEAQIVASTFIQQAEEENRKAMEEAGAKFKAAGEQYLADNAGRDGVTVTASGLQYEVLSEGNGKSPKATDSVKCHYEGRLIDGTVFDSSYRRGTPATFPLNGVIAGWTEGLQLMKEGAKFRFHIPFNLAYGANGAGESIPPYSALVFDVELIEVQ